MKTSFCVYRRLVTYEFTYEYVSFEVLLHSLTESYENVFCLCTGRITISLLTCMCTRTSSPTCTAFFSLTQSYQYVSFRMNTSLSVWIRLFPCQFVSRRINPSHLIYSCTRSLNCMYTSLFVWIRLFPYEYVFFRVNSSHVAWIPLIWCTLARTHCIVCIRLFMCKGVSFPVSIRLKSHEWLAFDVLLRALTELYIYVSLCVTAPLLNYAYTHSLTRTLAASFSLTHAHVPRRSLTQTLILSLTHTHTHAHIWMSHVTLEKALRMSKSLHTHMDESGKVWRMREKALRMSKS